MYLVIHEEPQLWCYNHRVSIFGAGSQAESSWQAQRHVWTLVDTSGGNCGTNLGDPGYSCADSSTTSSGTADVGELFFTHGRVLIQVDYGVQDEDILDPAVAPVLSAVHDIGARLDAIAAGHGA